MVTVVVMVVLEGMVWYGGGDGCSSSLKSKMMIMMKIVITMLPVTILECYLVFFLTCNF